MDAGKHGRSLAEQAAEELLEYIVAQDFSAGNRLPPEHELAELLSVGRSTMREAVRMLTSRNILEVRHGAGCFVRENPGIADDPFGFAFMKDKRKLAQDLIEFRMMVEPRCACLAASLCTPEDAQALQAQCDAVEALIEAGKPYDEADSLLHTMIAAIGGNCVLPKLMPIITGSIKLLIEVTGATLSQETIRTHRAIVTAVCKGDVLAAGDAMTLHLIYNRDRLRNVQ